MKALASFGFTERQRQFLVTVMVHAGCFLERQYCAFTGTVRGQNSREFVGPTRVARVRPCHRARTGSARTAVPRPPQAALRGDRPGRQPESTAADRRPDGRARDDSRCGARRPPLLVAEPRAETSGGSSRSKRDNYLRPEDYPHIAFGTGRQRVIRCFPDKLPIGVEKDRTDHLVFLYLVNRRIPVDFRQFLIRHAGLLRFVRTWTLRLLVPRRFRKAVVALQGGPPRGALDADESERHEGAGDVLSRVPGTGRTRRRPGRSRTSGDEFRRQGNAKIQALYRAWRRQGDRVLWDAHSTTLADDRSRGCSTVEVELLNRQYLQLTGTMDRDVWAKRGAKRKSRQVGPPVSALSPSPLSPLVDHEREPQANA